MAEKIILPSPDQTPGTVEEARHIIEAIRGYMGQMGNNDTEHSELNRILEELQREEISPQEAAVAARMIYERKMLNH